MDWKEFFTALVGSLAWPLAVVAVVTVLRKEIRQLLPGLREFQYRDLRLKFGRDLEEARDELSQAKIEKSQPMRTDGLSETEALRHMSDISPRATIIEAWRLLEAELMRVAFGTGHGDARRKSASAALRALQKREVAIPDAGAAIRRLRALRNEAAHAPDFALSAVEAREYAQLATAVTEYLRLLPPPDGQEPAP